MAVGFDLVDRRAAKVLDVPLRGAVMGGAAGIAMKPKAGGEGGMAFSQVLGQRGGMIEKSAEEKESERRKEADGAASGLVSIALIMPVLQQLRRSPFGEDHVFSGGIGEKAFGPQFDMQLADRIAQSPRLGIKNALADRMMNHLKPLPRDLKQTEAPKTHTGIDIHG